jgi:DNA polymerase I
MDSSIIQLEHDLIAVLVKMELEGIEIDINKLLSVELSLNKLNSDVIEKIKQTSNETLNLNSSEQLSDFLFNTLKIKPQKESVGKKGYYAVDKLHLQKLKNEHVMVFLILQYRKINSLLKFCDQLNNIHPLTKRLHSNLNQIGTSTGRFSCSKPNLQNVPRMKVIASETDVLKILESKFREVFIARKGNVLIGADYSQIELRVTAEMSQDAFLLKAYNNGIDIHILTASEVFKIKISEVSDEQRSIAKSINFGLIYGKTPIGLAGSLTEITKKEHSVEQAKQIMNDYFDRFKGVKSLLNGLVKKADKYGYSTTHFGRVRSIPELSSSKLIEREKGKRLAMNSPIQGTAADIIKMAMIACDKAISKSKLKSRMVLQVHDELLFEVPEDEVIIMEKLIKYQMENVVKLSIPLEVEIKKGLNWSMAH